MSIKTSENIHLTPPAYIPGVELPASTVEPLVLPMEPEINSGKS